MASAAFSSSLPFVLRWEGGFVDRPDDPGGRTNRGVTQQVYVAWRAGQGLPARDVKLIEDAEVTAIYESGYWIPPHCDRLAAALALVQFDTAVNMGVGRAIRFLQQSVGVTADGNFGPQSERAVATCDPGATVIAYCNTREAFYRDLASRKPAMKVFLKGWLNRLNALRREAGVPGVEATRGLDVDFGDTDYIAKVPDIESMEAALRRGS